MKERLTRNISVKILSILLAILLWLVITNMNDPLRYEIFSDVPVTILNESLVNNSKQSYDIVKGETIDFKVAARRSIIESLTDSDFLVTADFANLSNYNTVEVGITPRRYKDDIEIVDRGENPYMTISIEELSEKELKINVLDKGKVGEGYYIGSRSASPGIILVNGPKSRVDKIKQIVVEANVEGATRTITRILKPTALDEDGNVIDSSRLSFSRSDIEVEYKLYQIKEIPLIITATGQPADGYTITNIEYQPKMVEIAAEDAKLKDIERLEVAYDITGAMEDIEEFIELQSWLDNGVHLVGEDTTASVNIKIEKLETKEVSIWPNDIELKNKANSLQPIYITKGPIKVNILGPTSEIESITRSNLKPYINLRGYSSGTYYFDIETDISESITISDAPTVLLNLLYEP